MTNKRKRQEDFQKVKLKVGRKTKRADSSAEAKFKTKVIHLNKQLEEDKSLPTNKRKLSIMELLSQMHHYNAGVKCSALDGLKDLLSIHPSIIDSQISNIMSEVAAVFTDKDPTVRVAAVSLLQSLAPKIPQDKIAPFFPLVSAHLSSAMTHILAGIKEDSLKILDILLEEYPDLLIDRSNILLNNFLEIISHKKNSKEIKCGSKPCDWTLSISPNQKITSRDWRINVLTRLKKFLQALVRHAAEKMCYGEKLADKMEGVLSSKKVLNLTWREFAEGKQYIKLYEYHKTQQSANSSFQLRTLAISAEKTDKGLLSESNLKLFIQTVVPLLIECWIEELPGMTSDSFSENLEQASHYLLQQVLSIISLLWKLSEYKEESQKKDGWLRKSYLDVFQHYFMNHFPYLLCETVKQKKKTKKSKKDDLRFHNGLDHLLLNVTLCDIMVPLANSSTLNEDSAWLAMIRLFVSEKLNHGWKLNSKQLKRLLDVTGRLLNIQKHKVATEKLMQAVYVLYQQRDLPLSHRSMLIHFFNRVYLKEEDNCLILGRSRSKVLSCWLVSLPQQLAHLGSRSPQLSSLLIDTIYTASARSNKEMLQSLQTTACQIYDPKDGALVLLPLESQQRLVQLLYFLPFISSELLVCLNQNCISERLASNLGSMLIGILHARSSFASWAISEQDCVMNDADYFNFLFSTLIGFSADKLKWMQNNKLAVQISTSRVSPVCLYLTDQSLFNSRWTITKAICHSLTSVRARSQCFDILQNAIIKYLGGLVVIPDSTVGSILHAINSLLDQSCILHEKLHTFLASCCYSIFKFLLTTEKFVEHAHKRDSLWGSCTTLLTMLPKVLKLMLQSLQVSRASQEELPVIAQLLRLLLQNKQLRSHMMTNSFLVQQALQDVMNLKSCEIQEQWLTDLQYCFNVYLSKQPQEPSSVAAVY